MRFLSVPCVMWSHAGECVSECLFFLWKCARLLFQFSRLNCVLNVSDIELHIIFIVQISTNIFHLHPMILKCVSAFDRETNRDQLHTIQCQVVNDVYALVAMQQVCTVHATYIYLTRQCTHFATKAVEIARFGDSKLFASLIKWIYYYPIGRMRINAYKYTNSAKRVYKNSNNNSYIRSNAISKWTPLL